MNPPVTRGAMTLRVFNMSEEKKPIEEKTEEKPVEEPKIEAPAAEVKTEEAPAEAPIEAKEEKPAEEPRIEGAVNKGEAIFNADPPTVIEREP